MKEIKKILCAVDLSEHSAAVAEYATMLAKGLGASIIVVYTAPSLPGADAAGELDGGHFFAWSAGTGRLS